MSTTSIAANVPDLNTIFGGVAPVYEGATVHVAGLTLIVPKLSLGGVKRNADYITNMGTRQEEMKGKSGGAFIIATEAVPMITDAIRRNYPLATEEIVAELVDAGNYGEFLQAAFKGKEAEKVAETGGVAVAGEPEPATT